MIGFWERERETFEGWVAARFEQFRRETNAEVLSRRKTAWAHRVGRPLPRWLNTDEVLQGWSGPWETLKAGGWYSEEFVRWVEEDQQARRITWRQWRMSAAKHKQEPTSEDWHESVPALQDLAEYKRLAASFDTLVGEAREAGVPWSVIADATGLGRATLWNRRRVHGAPRLLLQRAHMAPVERDTSGPF
ncbi:hypothetical protein [Pseudoclavibacter sp. CFCC 13611]|uniref:hypothetical protein n=1 Tax=Pseudoclavibacter sp. CFCC 13611 TaxID=2615178 RepID=UPI0013012038|nr:hypothetical protein [Pseudoclavibacter sp. CFCC 13611]KAB1662768.1 hypothetical protein F8O08_09355 [Pseudoclavibacter sp. CFCC 13611]